MAENERRYGTATIGEAVQRLRSGGLVAVSTETVYGLAADSTNGSAVAEVYRAKGRPDFNPLIVHVPDMNAAQKLGMFNGLAIKLAGNFWPGPLTLVVSRAPDCPVTPAVTAGLETIALRCPAHPVMRALLDASGLFLAAPSANRSGGISPTTAQHVRDSLGVNSPMILDGGACTDGIESTIIAAVEDDYQILRPGPITAEELEDCLGQPALARTSTKIEAPGQMTVHYAPSKPVRLNAETARRSEYHIGFGSIDGDCNLSRTGDLAEAASNLFAYLHIADASDRGGIAVATVPMIGMGVAINDRLGRAASEF